MQVFNNRICNNYNRKWACDQNFVSKWQVEYLHEHPIQSSISILLT